jgi:hypothetical protein
MPSSGFFPDSSASTSTTAKPDGDKARADRYEKALKAVRDLPLNERVYYVCQGIVNEALEGK